MTIRYKTHNPCTVPHCQAEGCCLTCNHYKGGLEAIPTRIQVFCTGRPKSDNVVLPLHGYPEINGKADKNCAYFEGEVIA